MHFDMNFILISNVQCVSQLSTAMVIVLENLGRGREKRRQYFVLPIHFKLNGLSLCILFNKLVINNNKKK